MGEIAGLIIKGEQCSWCGVNFAKAHFYPVACKSCWEEEIKEYKDEEALSLSTSVQKAVFEEL